ncbi:11590_t:CDS:2 [Entrophospora sp. SA101]|nr:11590_t:CDS:2 [Entrophospora sp. SA101]
MIGICENFKPKKCKYFITLSSSLTSQQRQQDDDKVDNDIDKDFDDLVNLETMFIEIGKEDGIKAGFNSGKLEGYVLGCEKGFEISQEIGFYNGVTEIWLKFIVGLDDSSNLLPKTGIITNFLKIVQCQFNANSFSNSNQM